MEPPSTPQVQLLFAKAKKLTGPIGAFLRKAAGHVRKVAVVIWQHPQAEEARSVCRDFCRDLKKLWHHPKVAEFRARLRERFTQEEEKPEHPMVTQLRESLHPQYMALTAGTLVAVAMGLVGTKALDHSQKVRVHELSREAGMQIRQIRLQHNSQSIDSWRSEQQKLQRALKALEQSRSSGAKRTQSNHLWS